MNKQELINALRHGAFAERDTLEEAIQYARDVAPHGGIYTETAIHVLMNTIANLIDKAEVSAEVEK